MNDGLKPWKAPTYHVAPVPGNMLPVNVFGTGSAISLGIPEERKLHSLLLVHSARPVAGSCMSD